TSSTWYATAPGPCPPSAAARSATRSWPSWRNTSRNTEREVAMMDLHRRRFLQGACAAAALLSLPPLARGLSGALPRPALLLGESPAAARCAAAIGQPLPLPSPLLYPDQALAQLRALQGSRCIALLTPAEAVLFEEL